MPGKPTYEELERRVCELEASSLDRLIENIQAGVVVHGGDGSVVKSNTTAQTILNLTHEQMLGKELIDPYWEFLREDGSPMPIEEYPVFQVLATKRPVYNLILGVRPIKNAEPIWVLDTAIPEFDENGNISQIISTFMDISERKQAEEALRKKDAMLANIASQVPGMLYQFMMKPDGSLSVPYSSEGVKDIFGCLPEDVYNDFDPILRVIHPKDRNVIFHTINKSVKDLSQWKCEYRVQVPDQPIKWVFGNSIPEKRTDGSIVWSGYNVDITDRKHTETALQKSEEYFRIIAESSVEIIYQLDLNGNITFMSPAFERIYGYPLEEILNKNYKSFFPEYELDKATELIDKALAGEEYQLVEFIGKRKDNSTFPIEVSITPVYKKGEIVGIQGIIRDISERKHIEEKLKVSERKYRNIAESMPGLILKYKLNRDGSDQLLYINKGVEDLYGIQRDDALKNNTLLWDRVHPDDLGEYKASVKKSAENLSFWELEHRLKMPDGRVKWVRNRGVPTKQQDGSIVWDSLAVDITERKQAEQALKKSEQLLRNIIDTSTDYIFVKDKNLKTILCNKPFAKAVNKKPTDLIGKTDIENGWDVELVKGNPEKGIAGYEKDDLDALSGKIVQNTDTAIISGKTHFFDSIKIPLKSENNKIFGILGISRDITERKQLELEKDHLIDELKQALAKVKNLEGFLPICSYCKKIRDDKGYWNKLEAYIETHSDASFSHSMCPECSDKLYGNEDWYIEMKKKKGSE